MKTPERNNAASILPSSLPNQSPVFKRLEELKSSPNIVFNGEIVNDDTCIQVAQFMKENDIITKLESSDSYITAKGLGLIAESVITTKCLKKIAFPRNKISDNDKGFEEFINALIMNKTVIDLDLSENFLSDNSTIILSKLINRNNTIKSINLSKNSITQKGCENLLNAFNGNFNLEVLDLNGNKIDQDQINKILILQNRNSQKSQAFLQTFKMSPVERTIQNYSPVVKISPISVPREIVSIKDSKDIGNSSFEFKYNEIKKKYDEEKIELEMCKAGYVNEMEKEKEKRILLEQENSKLLKLVGEFQDKEKGKVNIYKEEKTELEFQILTLKKENQKLKELYSALKKSYDEFKEKYQIEINEKIHLLETLENDRNLIGNQLSEVNVEKEKEISNYKLRISVAERTLEEAGLERSVLEDRAKEIEKSYEEKLQMEKRVNEASQIKFANYKEKVKETKAKMKSELIQSTKLIEETSEKNRLLKVELVNQQQDIETLKNRIDSECKRLKDEMQFQCIEYEDKIKNYEIKIQEMNEVIVKEQEKSIIEKNKAVEDERERLLQSEYESSSKVSLLQTKVLELEKSRLELEEDLVKTKNLLLSEKDFKQTMSRELIEEFRVKINNGNISLFELFNAKVRDLEKSRDSFYQKNLEYIGEIKELRYMINNIGKKSNEISLVKNENETLSKSYDQSKLEIEKLQAIIEDKERTIKKMRSEYELKITSFSPTVVQPYNNQFEYLEIIEELKKNLNDEKMRVHILESELTRLNNFQPQGQLTLSINPNESYEARKNSLALRLNKIDEMYSNASPFAQRNAIIPYHIRNQTEVLSKPSNP